MIAVDNQGFAIQENKLGVRTQHAYEGLLSLSKYLDHEYHRVLAHEIDPDQMKAKRMFDEARKRELLEYLSTEKERILLTIEDMHGRMFSYYQGVLEEQCFVNQFLQDYEMRLVYPKSKWSLKVAKFTLRIMDDLHEVGNESTPEYQARELENKAIYHCQSATRLILCVRPIVLELCVKQYMEKTMPVSKPHRSPSIAFRYAALQLLSLYLETMSKFRSKQRKLDIFELLDRRYLELLLPLLKQTLVRLTARYRLPSQSTSSSEQAEPKNGSASRSSKTAVTESEYRLEERMLLPVAVQALRNALELMQYLDELPGAFQVILCQHLLLSTPPRAASVRPLSSKAAARAAAQAVANLAATSSNMAHPPSTPGKKSDPNVDFAVLSADSYPWNSEYDLFVDILCVLCRHPSIRYPAYQPTVDHTISQPVRHSFFQAHNAAAAASSSSAAPAVSYSDPAQQHIPPKSRSGLQLTTSIVYDTLQAMVYYHVVAFQQLEQYLERHPPPVPASSGKSRSIVGNANPSISSSNKNQKLGSVSVTADDANAITAENIVEKTVTLIRSRVMDPAHWEGTVMSLTLQAAQRLWAVLGPAGHLGSLVPREMSFFQPLDEIFLVSVDVLCLFYRYAVPSYHVAAESKLAADLLQTLHHVSYHRLASVFVQHAFLKVTFEATMVAFHVYTKPPPPPPATAPPDGPTTNSQTPTSTNPTAMMPTATNVTSGESERLSIIVDTANDSSSNGDRTGQKSSGEWLRQEIAIITQRCLAAFAVHHKQSLAITHLCCLTLRMLLRECFVPRAQCEDLLPMNLASFCAPYMASTQKLLLAGDVPEDDVEDDVPSPQRPIAPAAPTATRNSNSGALQKLQSKKKVGGPLADVPDDVSVVSMASLPPLDSIPQEHPSLEHPQGENVQEEAQLPTQPSMFSLGTNTLRSMASTTFALEPYAMLKLYPKHIANPLFHAHFAPDHHGQHPGEDSDSDQEGTDKKNGNKKDDASEGTSATSYTATLSANLSAGGLQAKNLERMKKQAQKQLQGAQEGENSATSLTLAEIIMTCAETHVSHAQTFEQVLLLVEHIASKSYLCKYVLVETGLPLVLQRYLQSRPHSLYLVGLAQLCLDELEI